MMLHQSKITPRNNRISLYSFVFLFIVTVNSILLFAAFIPPVRGELTLAPRGVYILSLSEELSGQTETYSVPIDTNVDNIVISVEGTDDISIYRPDGNEVTGTDPDVQIQYSQDSAEIFIIDPVNGLWNITLTGTGPVSLEIGGVSTLSINSFRFGDLVGRHGHQGFLPLIENPIIGEPYIAIAQLSEEVISARVDFRELDGAVIGTNDLALFSDETTLYCHGELYQPDMPYLIYISGTDQNNNSFQRFIPNVITPQSIEIQKPYVQDIVPSSTVTYSFTIVNHGPSETIHFSATDDRGYVASVEPSSINIETDDSASVIVGLQIPADVTPGATIVLKFNAETNTGTSENFAIIKSQVYDIEKEIVPNVVGITLSDATALLQSAGFNPISMGLSDNEVPVGVVSGQEQPAGSSLMAGSYITFTVSTGPEIVNPTVPQPVGAYDIVRYTEDWEDGSSFDSHQTNDFRGTAIFLDDVFNAAMVFRLASSPYFFSEFASYLFDETDGSIIITYKTGGSGDTSETQVLWNNLDLTLTGTAGEPGNQYEYTYYLQKIDNLRTIDPALEPLNWDVNYNGRLDMPDVINGLRQLAFSSSPSGTLIGSYDIQRYIEDRDNGTLFDSNDMNNFEGIAIFLKDIFSSVMVFEYGAQNYTVGDLAPYEAEESTGFIVFNPQYSGNLSSGTFTWNGLDLTLSGRTASSGNNFDYTYFLRKTQTIDMSGANTFPVNWDVNGNDLSDLPDIINGLHQLTMP